MARMDFIDAKITALIRREGGYVNRATDRGGPTKYGITERVARNYGYNGAMSDLREEAARAIYRQRYWFEPQFDHVRPASAPVALELFDTGVLMGPETAVRYLQRALCAFNNRAEHYPDLRVDGRIGPLTLSALAQFLRRRGAPGERTLVAALNCQQGADLLDLALSDGSQEEYVFGWLLNRVAL